MTATATTTATPATKPASAVDVERVRADFPILRRRVHGHPLVYLDSAATSQKPAAVIDAIGRYYQNSNANVHRGVYLLAEEATEQYEAARATVAGFVNAPRPDEIIFTRNTTEAINLVAYAWGRANVAAGDSVVITPEEHHSNFVPWQRLALEAGASLDFVDLNADGTLDLESLDRLLASGRAKIVAVAGVSNVLGTINPIREIGRRAHAAGARIMVDAAQMVPHMPVDLVDLDVDFFAFTGHKMLAPMGIGVLWARWELLEDTPPFLSGGEMIRKVTEDATTWNEPPWKFEAGTPNVEGAVGLEPAIAYLTSIGMDSVREHEKELVAYALDALPAVKGVTIYGPRDPELRGGVVSFTVDDIHPHDLASLVDRSHGVCIRAGHHCAQPLHDRLGLNATARASFYVYNQVSEIDLLCAAIEHAKQVMAG